MSVIYSNDFNRVVLQPNLPTTCFGGNPDGANVVFQACADYDPGVPAHRIGGGPPISVYLGPMYAGASKGGMYKNAAQPNLGSVAFRPASFTAVPHFHLDPGGLIVTVCQNPGVGSEAQSQTLYLLPFLKFFGPGKLSAQLVFDQPSATNDSNDAWAVSLNFKSGTQNDGGTDDQRFGPTCQFSGGGAVKLGQVQNPDPPTPGTYGGYEGATFTLTADLNIDADAGVSGIATLSYGGTSLPTKNITLTAGFTPAVITAVGVAVTSSKNNYTFVRARLLSFTLSATPLFFSINAPPEPTHQPIRKE